MNVSIVTQSLPSVFPASLNAPVNEVTLLFSTSNDEEDKAQTLSITLRQGNTQELPLALLPVRLRESKREGVALIHCLSAAVFNSIDKKTSCVRMSTCSSNCIWQTLFEFKFWFTLKGSQRLLFYLLMLSHYWTLSAQGEIQAAYQEDCPIMVMNSIILLRLAMTLLWMNGVPQ